VALAISSLPEAALDVLMTLKADHEHSSDEVPGKQDSERVMHRRSSGAHLGETQEQQKSGDSGMPGFDIFPEWLRVGPWSPTAIIFIFCFGIWLLWSGSDAVATMPTEPVSDMVDNKLARGSRFLAAIYCAFIMARAMRSFGWWPFVSYTMVAYTLLAFRLLASAIGLQFFAEVLRFPVLAMAWVTTTVWWLILVPLILVAMPGGREARWGFVKFNFSPFLINVHLLNLPIAMLDHRTAYRPLRFCDLWVSLLVAYAYMFFYLNVLDKNGIHFYIILSPRPWWCFLVYAAVVGIYVFIYGAFG